MSNTAPVKMYWAGEDIETLPRERLIQIIEEMGRELEGLRSPKRIRAYALGSVEMMRRGETAGTT